MWPSPLGAWYSGWSFLGGGPEVMTGLVAVAMGELFTGEPADALTEVAAVVGGASGWGLVGMASALREGWPPVPNKESEQIDRDGVGGATGWSGRSLQG